METVTFPVNYLLSFVGVLISLVVIGPLAWIVKGMIRDQKQLADDLNRLERELPVYYVRKDDFQKFQERILEKLDSIDGKLDKKVDK